MQYFLVLTYCYCTVILLRMSNNKIKYETFFARSIPWHPRTWISTNTLLTDWKMKRRSYKEKQALSSHTEKMNSYLEDSLYKDLEHAEINLEYTRLCVKQQGTIPKQLKKSLTTPKRSGCKKWYGGFVRNWHSYILIYCGSVWEIP